MSGKVKVKENREFVRFWSVIAVAYLPALESRQYFRLLFNVSVSHNILN